MLFENASN